MRSSIAVARLATFVQRSLNFEGSEGAKENG